VQKISPIVERKGIGTEDRKDREDLTVVEAVSASKCRFDWLGFAVSPGAGKSNSENAKW